MKHPKFSMIDLTIVAALASNPVENADRVQVRAAVTQAFSGPQRPYERIMSPDARAASRLAQVSRSYRGHMRRVVG